MAMDGIMKHAVELLIKQLPPETLANVQGIADTVKKFDGQQQAMIQAFGVLEANAQKRHDELKTLLIALIDTLNERKPDHAAPRSPERARVVPPRQSNTSAAPGT